MTIDRQVRPHRPPPDPSNHPRNSQHSHSPRQTCLQTTAHHHRTTPATLLPHNVAALQSAHRTPATLHNTPWDPRDNTCNNHSTGEDLLAPDITDRLNPPDPSSHPHRPLAPLSGICPELLAKAPHPPTRNNALRLLLNHIRHHLRNSPPRDLLPLQLRPSSRPQHDSASNHRHLCSNNSSHSLSASHTLSRLDVLKRCR